MLFPLLRLVTLILVYYFPVIFCFVECANLKTNIKLLFGKNSIKKEKSLSLGWGLHTQILCINFDTEKASDVNEYVWFFRITRYEAIAWQSTIVWNLLRERHVKKYLKIMWKHFNTSWKLTHDFHTVFQLTLNTGSNVVYCKAKQKTRYILLVKPGHEPELIAHESLWIFCGATSEYPATHLHVIE